MARLNMIVTVLLDYDIMLTIREIELKHEISKMVEVERTRQEIAFQKLEYKYDKNDLYNCLVYKSIFPTAEEAARNINRAMQGIKGL